MKKFLIIIPMFVMPLFAFADGIVLDGTMGINSQVLNGTDVTIEQNFGKTVGNNLFHSFSDFNIDKGQTVNFTGSDNLQNVISRVTGDNKSIIDGTLQSEIKNADFYFINPNGITFGANASVDVPAAFHVTTADKMDFGKNGGVFYADKSKNSSLSSESPTALGFLGTSKANNGLLTVDGSQLKNGNSFDAVAGEIALQNSAKIKMSAGEIRLVAIQGEESVDLNRSEDNALSLPNINPSSKIAGSVFVNNSKINTSGIGGGSFIAWGNTIDFKDSSILTDNNGVKSAGIVNRIDIRANSMNLENSTVTFDTFGIGEVGEVSVMANNLNLLQGSKISSSAFGVGKAGNVTVNADNLIIDGGSSWIVSDALGGSGNAGNVVVNAKKLEILNLGRISSSTFSKGDAGSVTVIADNLFISGRDNKDAKPLAAGILSIASKNSLGGKAGSVIVNAKELEITTNGQISSSTFSKGDAGSVRVVTDNLSLNHSGIYSQANINELAPTESIGLAGNVSVKVKNSLKMDNDSKISTAHHGNALDSNLELLAVSASNIDMNKSQITTESSGNVDAGNINVNFSNRLNMDNSFINTTANTGNGGSINVTGGEVIYLKNSGFKTTVSGENSNGGDISTKAQMLIMDTGLIQANAVSGNGGNINLALQALIPSANQLIKGGKSVDWDKSPSNVIQAASQSGVSGTVNNSAPQMNLSGVLANIGNNNFDNRLVNQDYCAVGKGSSLSKKGKGGLPLRAKDLQVY